MFLPQLQEGKQVFLMHNLLASLNLREIAEFRAVSSDFSPGLTHEIENCALVEGDTPPQFPVTLPARNVPQ